MKGKTLIACVITLLLVSMSYADLVIEVRAIGTNNPGQIDIQAGGKHVDVMPGATGTITLGLYATLQNFTNDGTGTNDLLINNAGSIIVGAAPSDTLGNLGSPDLDNAWDAAGSGNGLVQDLNADTYMDIGSNNNADTSAKFIWMIADTAPVGQMIAIGSTLIHTSVYTISSAVITGDVQVINFFPRANTNSIQYSSNASWSENGVNKTGNPALGTYRAGTDVVIGIPEPSTLVLLCMGVLAMVAIRRKKKINN